MDRREQIGKVTEYLKKYRVAFLVLLAGILLMVLPEGTKRESAQSPPEETVPAAPDTLQNSLEKILCQIEGAGKVQVLLTEAEGEKTLYQTDNDTDVADGTRRQQQKTVIVTDASREEAGLIRQVNPPSYLGAVVLCQGADRAAVRLAIVEAVASATGLTSDKITVLKMK